jgi:hypothetical protein
VDEMSALTIMNQGEELTDERRKYLLPAYYRIDKVDQAVTAMPEGEARTALFWRLRDVTRDLVRLMGFDPDDHKGLDDDQPSN